MIRPKHSMLLDRLAQTEGLRFTGVHKFDRIECLYNIYYKKVGQYWLRDFKNNKTNSLLHYRDQEDRAIANIIKWYYSYGGTQYE